MHNSFGFRSRQPAKCLEILRGDLGGFLVFTYIYIYICVSNATYYLVLLLCHYMVRPYTAIIRYMYTLFHCMYLQRINFVRVDMNTSKHINLHKIYSCLINMSGRNGITRTNMFVASFLKAVH
jgi:hypothetical protein